MRKCLLGAVAVAFLMAPAPVSAVLIDYTFESGTSACFEPEGCVSPGSSFLLQIAGSFTFDTDVMILGPLHSTNITLTGGPLFPLSSVTLLQGTVAGNRLIEASAALTPSISVLIPFALPLADAMRNPLGDNPDDFQLTIGFEGEHPFSLTGAAVPGPVTAPEPTSFALIAAALGLLCLGYLMRTFVQHRADTIPAPPRALSEFAT